MSFKNQGKFDGLPVEFYEGRFSGAFELDDYVGQDISVDDVVAFLVVADADKVNIAVTKSGDLKRTNTFKTGMVKVVPISILAEVTTLIEGEATLFETFEDADLESDTAAYFEPPAEYDLDLETADPSDVVVVKTTGPDPALSDFLYGDEVNV